MSFFALATLVGLGFGKSGRWLWWLGLAAAILGLFTMASGLIAPMAVGGLVILRAIKQRRLEKRKFRHAGNLSDDRRFGRSLDGDNAGRQIVARAYDDAIHFRTGAQSGVAVHQRADPDLVRCAAFGVAAGFIFSSEFSIFARGGISVRARALERTAIRRARLWPRQLWRWHSCKPLHGFAGHFCHRQPVCSDAAAGIVDGRKFFQNRPRRYCRLFLPQSFFLASSKFQKMWWNIF